MKDMNSQIKIQMIVNLIGLKIMGLNTIQEIMDMMKMIL